MLRRERHRRRLSMTSLIDIIFLLLLFFMLSSTFSRFSEVELASAASGTGQTEGDRPLFLRLGSENITLNGQPANIGQLPELITASQSSGSSQTVLVSLAAPVSSQQLIDVMVVLRAIPGISVAVLETG
ncbi:biopolymer transporter ExbD [Pseudaestuariivita rosea]|uniref:biopolymer transporter ExbD n=1 Tax=Pseudaestuariivita rosea TaxID=2763263 RepID=UPI001ABA0579|nr:biopolymer transporter ExbD [Pseudaestuariivita rosea]